MTEESRRPNIKRETGIDPLVCPRGHHSVALRTNYFTCRTCENQGRDQISWDRSELVDLREEEPPLRDDAEVMTDGGPSADGTERDCLMDHGWCNGPDGETVDGEAFGGLCGECYIKRSKEAATAQNGGEPDGE